jgi:hypothetical protein
VEFPVVDDEIVYHHFLTLSTIVPNGKSSHCLWQGELKKNKQTNNNKNKTKDIFLCEFLEHVHTFS